MNGVDEVIFHLAEGCTRRIARRVILGLQALSDGLQSGADSPLTSTWDEICVQVQSGESVLWEVYDQHVRSVIADEIQTLAPHERCAIWLQTDAGIEWQCSDEVDSGMTYDEDGVISQVADEVYTAAGSWSNARIRAFIDNSW